jgi:hypothetical protein
MQVGQNRPHRLFPGDGNREPRRPPKRHAVGEGFDHERDDEQNPVEIAKRMPLLEPRGNRKPERKPRWVGKSK